MIGTFVHHNIHNIKVFFFLFGNIRPNVYKNKQLNTDKKSSIGSFHIDDESK